jgi:hypothetical protein
MTTAELYAAAQRAREEAERQYKTSEYPRYGRGAHLDVAAALENLAATLQEIGEDPPKMDGDRFAHRRATRVYWLKRKAAEKRLESARLRARSHDMGSTRPLGQPLVGSPQRRRAQARAIDRANRVDDKAHEAYNEAQELDRRAKAAERNRSIYRTDPRSVEKLRAKLAKLEAQRDAFKKARAARPTFPLLNYRAPDGIEVENRYHDQNDHMPQIEMTKAEWKRIHKDYKGSRRVAGMAHRVRDAMRNPHGPDGGMGTTLCAVFLTDSKEHPRPLPGSETVPEPVAAPPAYSLTNLGANIRRVRQQIEEHEAMDDQEERPERRITYPGPEMDSDVIIRDNLEFLKVELHFPGKPSDEIRHSLRTWGFRWVRSAGCWSRSISGETEARLGWLAQLLGGELI